MRFGTQPQERQGATVNLNDDVLALLRQPSICYLATTMPDGSPQVTQIWVDTDGEHVLINSVETHVKVRNIKRDPRVVVAIAARDTPSRYVQIRGRVVSITTDGAVGHIEMLAQKYLGKPYPWYGGRDQVRVILVIAPEHIMRPSPRDLAQQKRIVEPGLFRESERRIPCRSMTRFVSIALAQYSMGVTLSPSASVSL